MLNIVKLQEGIPQFHNVNPGLINHGFLTRGGTPPIVIIGYLYEWYTPN